MTDLGSFGGPYCHATSINNSGQVAGFNWTSPSDHPHAFLWQHDVMIDLTTATGVGNGGAERINERGQAIGEAEPGPQPVVWSIGRFVCQRQFGC